LVLNVLRGLNSSFDHLRTWITRQKPFLTFLQVWDDLVLEEITRGPVTASPTFASSTSKALVTTPPTSASHSSSLLGPPSSGPSGGGGGKGEKGGRRRRGGVVERGGTSNLGGAGGGGGHTSGGAGGGGGGTNLGGAGGGRRGSVSTPAPGGMPWPSFANPWSGRISMWPSRVSRPPCSLVLLRSGLPGLPSLARGVGSGNSGAVLQHHGPDSAGWYRVDR
jgi:hypothetical protein